MLLAWSLAELIRNTYYTLSLLSLSPSAPIFKLTTYLRYTAFYALYPIGAGSEYALILNSFPPFPQATPGRARGSKWTWKGYDMGGGGDRGWLIGGWLDSNFWARVGRWVAGWGYQTWAKVPLLIVWPASEFSSFALLALGLRHPPRVLH